MQSTPEDLPVIQYNNHQFQGQLEIAGNTLRKIVRGLGEVIHKLRASLMSTNKHFAEY